MKVGFINTVVLGMTLISINVHAAEQDESSHNHGTTEQINKDKAAHHHDHSATKHHDHAEELHAHVHGLSEIRLVIENKNLEIEMTSPAVDLVGFEHQAHTKEELAVVERTESILEQHTNLLSFVGGSCVLANQTIDLSSIKPNENDVENKQSNHSEITTNYTFHCEEVQELSSIIITAFDTFSSVSQIDAMWITDTMQEAAKLNANNNVINIK